MKESSNSCTYHHFGNDPKVFSALGTEAGCLSTGHLVCLSI